MKLGTVYVGISALSWDPADYNWKINHDAGGEYEVLWSGDLSKSAKNGGKHKFVADAWLPSDAIRGEAELLLGRDDAMGQAYTLEALHESATSGRLVTL